MIFSVLGLGKTNLPSLFRASRALTLICSISNVIISQSLPKLYTVSKSLKSPKTNLSEIDLQGDFSLGSKTDVEIFILLHSESNILPS